MCPWFLFLWSGYLGVKCLGCTIHVFELSKALSHFLSHSIIFYSDKKRISVLVILHLWKCLELSGFRITADAGGLSGLTGMSLITNDADHLFVSLTFSWKHLVGLWSRTSVSPAESYLSVTTSLCLMQKLASERWKGWREGQGRSALLPCRIRSIERGAESLLQCFQASTGKRIQVRLCVHAVELERGTLLYRWILSQGHLLQLHNRWYHVSYLWMKWAALPLRVKQISARVTQLGCCHVFSLGKGYSLKELKRLVDYPFTPEPPGAQQNTHRSFITQGFKFREFWKQKT